jgi:hypothetical protein
VELGDGGDEDGRGKEGRDCCLWKAGKGTEKMRASGGGRAWVGYDGGMKTRILMAAIMAAGALAVAGCQSTPEKRIAKNEAAFAAMPADVQAKIRAGEVAVGFTPQQVELAKGKADRVVRRTTAKGEEQSWIYEKRASGLGFGIGVGGGSGGMGGGVGVGTGGRGPEVAYVVNFSGGVVASVEDYAAR